MRLLLNQEVQVLISPNKAQEGIKGKVVFQKNKKNSYVVILTEKNQYKMVEKGVLKGKDFILNLNCRNTRSIKRVRSRLTVLWN